MRRYLAINVIDEKMYTLVIYKNTENKKGYNNQNNMICG